MTEQQEYELFKWTLDNMFKCEFGMLDEKQHKLFLDLIEEKKDQPFIQKCFRVFENWKKKNGLPTTE